jgi:hypothetical protein
MWRLWADDRLHQRAVICWPGGHGTKTDLCHGGSSPYRVQDERAAGVPDHWLCTDERSVPRPSAERRRAAGLFDGVLNRLVGHPQPRRTEMVAEKVEAALGPADEGVLFCCDG